MRLALCLRPLPVQRPPHRVSSQSNLILHHKRQGRAAWARVVTVAAVPDPGQAVRAVVVVALGEAGLEQVSGEPHFLESRSRLPLLGRRWL